MFGWGDFGGKSPSQTCDYQYQSPHSVTLGYNVCRKAEKHWVNVSLIPIRQFLTQVLYFGFLIYKLFFEKIIQPWKTLVESKSDTNQKHILDFLVGRLILLIMLLLAGVYIEYANTVVFYYWLNYFRPLLISSSKTAQFNFNGKKV